MSLIIMLMPAGIIDGPPIMPVPMPVVGAVIPIRSIMTFIVVTPFALESRPRGPQRGLT
jgi:hypothetical protein